jgi:hypothetical protein
MSKQQGVPEAEDIPIVLAVIRSCADPLQRCERKRCNRLAVFTVDGYEDQTTLEQAAARLGLAEWRRVEEELWKQTVREQMLNHFTVYQTFSICLPCQLDVLKTFLCTNLERDIKGLLAIVLSSPMRLVQFHFLSYPEMGMVTLTPCTTVPEFLAWMRAGKRVEHTIQE